jgi:hypothetical protein
MKGKERKGKERKGRSIQRTHPFDVTLSIPLSPSISLPPSLCCVCISVLTTLFIYGIGSPFLTYNYGNIPTQQAEKEGKKFIDNYAEPRITYVFFLFRCCYCFRGMLLPANYKDFPSQLQIAFAFASGIDIGNAFIGICAFVRLLLQYEKAKPE